MRAKDIAGRNAGEKFQLPAEFPPHAVNPLQEENAALKKEIEMLKKENEVLREVAGVKR